jgi:N6-adenosine-specific RNA methylase IME4
MKFNVICSDPAWAFSDRLQKMKSPVKRSAVSQYDVMGPKQVAEIDVRSIADPSWSVLALWVPSTLLAEGLNVMTSWGYCFKQTFVWVKIKKNIDEDESDLNNMIAFGMGRLFRQAHEIALIGTMGSVYSHLKNKSQRSVEFDINQGHSTKPELLQDRLERMFPEANKLEMFSRRIRPGWTCVGNAIDGKDINQSIRETALL